jgi:hypothetical protein
LNCDPGEAVQIIFIVPKPNPSRDVDGKSRDSTVHILSLIIEFSALEVKPERLQTVRGDIWNPSDGNAFQFLAL